MALAASADRGVASALGGYRKVVVPIVGNPESERAVEVACLLASEGHAAITVVTVIEVPALLPLDARMTDEESEARRLHNRATAIGDVFGVAVVSRVVRGREAATAILEELEGGGAELVVIGAIRKTRVNRRATAFGNNVQRVLRKAPCRVLVVAAAASA